MIGQDVPYIRKYAPYEENVCVTFFILEEVRELRTKFPLS